MRAALQRLYSFATKKEAVAPFEIRYIVRVSP